MALRTMSIGAESPAGWNEGFHREKYHKEGSFGETNWLESQNKE